MIIKYDQLKYMSLPYSSTSHSTQGMTIYEPYTIFDSNRQGESGDVRTWPEWSDPRAPALLRGLLAGLAAKVARFADPAVGGLPASVRQAVQFLRGRGYPTKRWLRPFGCELLRRGVPAHCLPKCVQAALQARQQPASFETAGSREL